MVQSPVCTEHGELEGHFGALKESSARCTFVITDGLTGKKIPCSFVDRKVEGMARDARDRRIVATGEITVDRHSGETLKIRVDEIRVLGARAELPQIDDLIGIDITDGVESSEYVRNLRDAE